MKLRKKILIIDIYSFDYNLTINIYKLYLVIIDKILFFVMKTTSKFKNYST